MRLPRGFFLLRTPLSDERFSMYAIVDISDKQFKVRSGETLYVPHQPEAEAGETLTFERVLLLSDGDGEVTMGTPTVDDASVSARVVDHVKGDKVIVFKKKRRKRHRVKKGHRQQYTQIQVEDLATANGTAHTEDDSTEQAADSPETESAEEEAGA
jgi:large subunit ribosomal protein L21